MTNARLTGIVVLMHALLSVGFGFGAPPFQRKPIVTKPRAQPSHSSLSSPKSRLQSKKTKILLRPSIAAKSGISRLARLFHPRIHRWG